MQHTTFTSDIANGEKRADGKVVPDWRGEQRDDNGIYMPDRATAHYALYNAPEAGLGRTLLVAGTESLLPVLKNYSDSLDHLPLNEAIASKKVYDTILIVNRLEIERDPTDTLKKLHARLSEDGRLYFHANFHYGDEKSVQRDDGSWALGWDVLSTLNAAGFSTPAAITFWSQELGYFGPSNLVFEASK
ncbi:hypothetical protein [Asticcacaulis sp. YBE204]|uniref:hypothetical protein n=1 Tax=Asticcacaulis sp. YBE204 TaxID=1282363 RepID=UPI0012DE29C4|nr:hypothetical protein [Asticcacaulis sp. YBE204]